MAFKQKACSPRNINFIGIFILFLRLQNLESESFADSCYQHFFKNRNFRYYSWNLLVPFIQFFGLIAPGNTGRYLTHLFELFVQHLVILHLLPSFWMLLSPGIATSITTALFCSELPPLYPLAGSILARETNSHCGCMTKNIKHDQTIKATRCGDPCDKGAGVKQNEDVELYQLKSH